MDIDKVTEEANKVVEKVAKVSDLILLVSLDWCNLVLSCSHFGQGWKGEWGGGCQPIWLG